MLSELFFVYSRSEESYEFEVKTLKEINLYETTSKIKSPAAQADNTFMERDIESC